MIRTRPWMLTFVTGALVVVLAGTAFFIGGAGRHYLGEQRVINASSAADAYRQLRDTGAHGRTMILLDTQANIVPRVYDRLFEGSLADTRQAPPFQSRNVTGGLIETDVARTVYSIPPASARADAEDRLGTRWDALRHGDRLELRYYGAPVHVVLGEFDPAELDEPVIVYARKAVLDQYDPEFIERLTSPDVADAVVIVSEP